MLFDAIHFVEPESGQPRCQFLRVSVQRVQSVQLLPHPKLETAELAALHAASIADKGYDDEGTAGCIAAGVRFEGAAQRRRARQSKGRAGKPTVSGHEWHVAAVATHLNPIVCDGDVHNVLQRALFGVSVDHVTSDSVLQTKVEN